MYHEEMKPFFSISWKNIYLTKIQNQSSDYTMALGKGFTKRKKKGKKGKKLDENSILYMSTLWRKWPLINFSTYAKCALYLYKYLQNKCANDWIHVNAK